MLRFARFSLLPMVLTATLLAQVLAGGKALGEGVPPDANVAASRMRPVVSGGQNPATAEGDTRGSGVLEEVVVTATFRDIPLTQAPVSATVLNSATLQQAGQQHFQDVLALVPNLNWAGGSSRPRNFQIRGVGEREQYEGAPDPSVGFLIDDIDFSGIGMPATLFDTRQVEVLRGPQGTRYGANALAGLIVVRTEEPAQEFGVDTELSAGDYGTWSAGVAATGPVESLDSAWRLSVQQYRSNGFRRDVYLHRDATNDRDELSARFKWRWQPTEDTRVDFTLLHADLDNGYDAFSIDNSRISQTDRPGKDTQRSTGGAVKVTTPAAAGTLLTAIATYADSKMINNFDDDWGNAQLWAPYTYDYYEGTTRDRKAGSLELRLASNRGGARAAGSGAKEAGVSAGVGREAGEAAADGAGIDWLIGVYALDLRESLTRFAKGIYEDPSDPLSLSTLDDSLASHYSAKNLALFGQLEGRLAERWRWSAGARVEQRKGDYRDSGIQGGLPEQENFTASDHMAGGQFTLSHDLGSRASLYASVSRGYKAGGFNLGTVPADSRRFDPEYLWNYEVGAKGVWFDGRLAADTAVFFEKRRDMQIRDGQQLIAGDPSSFVFVTRNASGGSNYGLESSLRWRVVPQFTAEASLGLLRTRYLDYAPEGVDLSRRDQAHAPRYEFALSGLWVHPSGWMARVDLTGMDAFYFDVPPNDTRSHAYALTNVKLGYAAERWSAYAWGRNVFDRVYAVRGFFFGNEPPNFADSLYIQRGDPRQFGVTFQFRL